MTSSLTDCIERLNEAVRQLEVAVVEMDACIEYLGKVKESVNELRIVTRAQPNMNWRLQDINKASTIEIAGQQRRAADRNQPPLVDNQAFYSSTLVILVLPHLHLQTCLTELIPVFFL